METICAIATAPGGAIGIVRLSGDDAISLTEKILDRHLQEKVTYAHILDDGEILDEVIVTIFWQPHSYTGENTAEISCHIFCSGQWNSSLRKVVNMQGRENLRSELS